MEIAAQRATVEGGLSGVAARRIGVIAAATKESSLSA